MNHSSYKTKQREAVLDYIISRRDSHVTVNQICDYFSEKEAPIGVATVYRYLDKLVEQGLVQKYVLEGSAGACFQYVDKEESCTRHFHLKCEHCGKLIHLECSHFEALFNHIIDEHQFTVNPFRTVIYGVCKDCKKNFLEEK